MTTQEYADHVREFLAEMKSVTDVKNVDYSAGQSDAMANYYELSLASGCTPFQAWMVLMMKHVTAVMRFSKVGSVASEPIHGRLIDLANYAMLGDALIKDMAVKGVTGAVTGR